MRRRMIFLMGMAVAAFSGHPAGVAEPLALQADVCVVGGGSGGIGAAVAAARAGAQVVLVEKQPKLGGTSCRALVSSWEPGPGSPLAKELYERLRERGAAGITRDHNADRKQGPFGLWLVTPGPTYEETLKRAANTRENWRTVSFDPDALHDVVVEILNATGKCRLLLDTTFTGVDAADKRIRAIRAVGGDGAEYVVEAKVFIDCTGGVHLCQAAGCPLMLGPEPRSRFGELSAPEEVEDPLELNAVTLCYRIRPSDNPKPADPPKPPGRRKRAGAHVHSQTDGKRVVNPLGIIAGRDYIELGYEKTYAKAQEIVRQHWFFLQQHPAFAGFEFECFAPMLGIRESWRVEGEYVLTQHDVLATLAGQRHSDLIALADHALDTHSPTGGKVRELKGYYGVPYRCLIPKGWQNLLAACRGSSFSHIAASSCRLSRTMMALGHAAGLAAAQAAARGGPVAEVDVKPIQDAVGLKEVLLRAQSQHD